MPNFTFLCHPSETAKKLVSQNMKLNHSSLYPLPPFFLSHCLLFRALFWTLPCIYIHPSSPFYAVYLSLRLLFSSLQMLIGSPKRPPIPLRLRPAGVDALSIFDLIAGLIPFTASGLINRSVLHAYYWLTVTEWFSLHHIPSIWQRSFSIASAVASSSCGSSSSAGTESGLGRSDRQLSEEHSSAAPCCCLYRWCSTRNCSSGAAARSGEEKWAIKAKLEGWEEQFLRGNVGRTRTSVVGKWCETKPVGEQRLSKVKQSSTYIK